MAIGTAVEHRKGAGTEISESTSVKRVIGRAAAGADDEPNRLPGDAAAVVLSVDLVREHTGVDNVATTSMKSARSASGLREKAKEELRTFSAIAIYLALMLEALFSYRSLTLSESGITGFHYGVAVIEALVLAKVIMIGQTLRLGKGLEDKPLIVSVLVKTLLFGAFVALFSVFEHVIEGLVHHDTWAVIAHQLFAGGRDEILARTLVIIVAFIPFFGFSEVDRVLGHGKLFALFFRKRTP